MPYTWTTQMHITTASRNDIQVEAWVRKPHGWENVETSWADSLDVAYEVSRSIRANISSLPGYRAPITIAAVKFTPRGHHRLVTWHGTYNEGDSNA